MDSLINAKAQSVTSIESDRTDNSLFAEKSSATGSNSSSLKLKTVKFENNTAIKQEEKSVDDKTLNELGFNEDTETWNDDQPQKHKIVAVMKKMIERNVMPNIEIVIGDNTFKCHLYVLQCYSSFFKTLTCGIEVHLPQDKITPKAFSMMYKWMLTENPHFMPEGLAELFFAARFLEVEELVRQCWFCFGDIDSFREDTAFLMYMKATKAGHKDLEQLMLMRVSKFFLTVVASRDFLDLTVNELCDILSSNSIGVNSEIDVLFSAVRWLTHNWQERNQFQLNVVKCVRFNLLPSWYLVTLTKHAVSPEVLQVVNHPEVEQMISDGLSYVTSQLFYSKSDIKFQKFLKDMELTSSAQRIWIYDKQGGYHNTSISQKMAGATYESFNDYLGRIRILGGSHWQQLELAKDVNGSVSNSSP